MAWTGFMKASKEMAEQGTFTEFANVSLARTGAPTHTRQSANIYSSAYHLASARIGRGIG
jgi:hypothetical protein